MGRYHWNDPPPGYSPGPTVPAVDPGTTRIIRKVSTDTDVQPGEELWVWTQDGQQLVLTILHEPAGQHCRIKRRDNSTGTVVCVPIDGTIDGQTSFMIAPGEAFEFDSDGTDFVVF